MVAKSPSGIYERLAYRHNDISAASELAALSLIRPSTTCGHLGDVVGEKLIYDAPTAHGGSGGPVFNSNGEVIGVNSAYMDGFTGGTIGVSVDSLRPLLQEARTKQSPILRSNSPVATRSNAVRCCAKIRWVTAMPNLPSLYIANTLLRSALIVACIVIGLTVRVALMAQPGTRFQSYWRLFFKRYPTKN